MEQRKLNTSVEQMHRACNYCEFVTANGTENMAKHIHDNHVNEYYQELAKEENRKMKNKETDSDSDSDVDISKMSLEERTKRYEQWVENFHKVIDKNLPEWICSSCHKLDFERKMANIETKRVKNIQERFPLIFHNVVTKHKIISPKNISDKDLIPDDDKWKVAGCIIVEGHDRKRVLADTSKTISEKDKTPWTGVEIRRGYYVCHTCLRFLGQNKYPPCSAENGAGFGWAPKVKELEDLTPLEFRIVSALSLIHI